jgi:hypothetical protein
VTGTLRQVAARSPVELAPSRGGARALLECLGVYAAYLLLTAVFLEAVRRGGHTFFQDVIINGYAPDREAAADFLKGGYLPHWTRDLYGGQPFAANIQHAVYYPGNLPFLLFAPAVAMKVVVATTVAFGASTMWAYCRFALRTSGAAAFLGGLAFGFGGMSLQHIILTNQLQAIAWMPLLLLFAHLALEEGRLRWVVASALSIGLQFLAGHPEEWVYTLAALALYALAWSLAEGPAAWPRRAVTAVVRTGGSLALFACLFGWQLFPTLTLRSQGFRSDPSFRQQFPLPQESAVNAMLPDFGKVLVGENVFHVGVVALGLAALGLWAGGRGLGWVRIWLAAIAAGGFVMALGNATAPYRFLYENVDLVRGFRVPARYLLLPSFALAAAAALGTDALLRNRVGEWRGRVREAAGGLGVLLVTFGFTLGIAHVTRPGPSTKWWALAAVAGVAAWALAGWARVPRAAVAALLLLVTGLELHQARPHAEYRSVAPRESLDLYGPVIERIAREGGRMITIARLPEEGGPGPALRVPERLNERDATVFNAGFGTRAVSRPNTHVGRHVETAIGRDGGLMPLRRYREFFAAASGSGGEVTRGLHFEPPSAWRWEVLDFLAVRWFVTNPLPREEAAVLRAHGFRPVLRYAFAILWKRAEPPLIRVEDRVAVVPRAANRLAALRSGPALSRRAIVEEPVRVQRGATGRVDGERVDHSSVSATVRSTGAALLVLADPWYPGWRAYVDGRPQKLLRVNHAFRGVRVPAGAHRVEFRFEDSRYRWGVGLAAFTALCLLLTVALRRRLGSGP